jgi:predicted nucleotidyltransferase
MILNDLEEKRLLGTGNARTRLPHWLVNNCIYLTISGSISYGCADTNADEASDFDTIGICIPPKELVFPYLLGGYIFGFGVQPQLQPGDGSGVYEEHHINDPSARGGKGRQYDLNIYNIIKFLDECAKGNPNLIDSLFTNRECVLHCTQVGNIIRDNRKIFLAKNLWATYKGYAYSQFHKMTGKKPVGKRIEYREKYGFDIKFAYNIIRLIDEAEQIFTEGDLDLQRNREQLKAIRRGDWSVEQIREYVNQKEKLLEELHLKSDLPTKPNVGKVREVLLQCLEHHYGSLDKFVHVPDRAENLLLQIKQLMVDAGY